MFIKGAFFDLDGTLIDSIDDLADTANYALTKNGFPAKEVKDFFYFFGEGIENAIRRAAPLNTPEDILRKMVEESSAAYAKGWANKTRVYDGIKELLEELKKTQNKARCCYKQKRSPCKRSGKSLFPQQYF